MANAGPYRVEESRDSDGDFVVSGMGLRLSYYDEDLAHRLAYFADAAHAAALRQAAEELAYTLKYIDDMPIDLDPFRKLLAKWGGR